jgi:hypothetical protein
VSTILDALKKASEERTHVRSPIAGGDLFSQTRFTPRPREIHPSNAHSVTTAALAVGALVLTATVFIGIVVWASRTAGHQQAAVPVSAALAPPMAPAQAPPPAAPAPSEIAAASATPPRVVHNGSLGQSRVEQYMQTTLQPPAPIPLAGAAPTAAPAVMEQDVSEELPPPEGLAVLPDFERSWEEEVALEAADDEPFVPPPDVRGEDEEPAPSSAPSGPRFALEGIVYNDERPMAIINGSIVGVGDSVAGAQVARITVDSVALMVDGHEEIIGY